MVSGGDGLEHILPYCCLRLTSPTTQPPPTPASHSGGVLRRAWSARLPFASVSSGFRLEEQVRTTKEEVTGKSGLGQDDITALGGVLESCFIPDIKSPSRLGIYYRSRLDDVAARAFYTAGSDKKETRNILSFAKPSHVDSSPLVEIHVGIMLYALWLGLDTAGSDKKKALRSFCRRGARASCTSCKSSASCCCLQHLFQDFKLRC